MGEHFPFRIEEAGLLNSESLSTRKKKYVLFSEYLYHINITQQNEKTASNEMNHIWPTCHCYCSN